MGQFALVSADQAEPDHAAQKAAACICTVDVNLVR
jgi:hypothetical protein